MLVFFYQLRIFFETYNNASSFNRTMHLVTPLVTLKTGWVVKSSRQCDVPVNSLDMSITENVGVYMESTRKFTLSSAQTSSKTTPNLNPITPKYILSMYARIPTCV